jgi:hypothetical protein
VGLRISRACLSDEVEKPEVMASIFRSEVVQMALAPDFKAPILGFTYALNLLGLINQGWGNHV